MNCWRRNTELIWGGDHMVDEVSDELAEVFDIVSNFTCPECQSYVEFYNKKNSE